ncbi:hypothetical protein NUW54_g588 [Trametes sanguinea]|uniref:Uncharacterized protein n=1 Tax=Trametes sanguinea TaxID=158606 RepID=A0ACC1QBI0_9APHY|nr:hypothetical protein NUW54_g588 [Trametes sanguinea]
MCPLSPNLGHLTPATIIVASLHTSPASPRYTAPRTLYPPRLLTPFRLRHPTRVPEATTTAGNLPITEDAEMDDGSAATSTSSLPVDDHRSDNSDVLSTPSER